MPAIKYCYALTFVGLISLFLAFFLMFKSTPVRVVTFDKERLIKAFVTQLSRQTAGVEKTDELSARFAQLIKEHLNRYAMHHHAVVIKKDMVLASDEDITSLIGKQVADTMRRTS